jgi:hypothetical protein
LCIFLPLNNFEKAIFFFEVSSSTVRIEITQIHMLFIVETTDLNKDLLNEETSYHIPLEVGSPNG